MMRSTLPAVAAAPSLLVTPALAADGDARRGAEQAVAEGLIPAAHIRGVAPELEGFIDDRC